MTTIQQLGELTAETKQAKPDPEYCEFLENLRGSGQTNMFGAAAYLADEFDLPPKEARKILMQWMATYEG